MAAAAEFPYVKIDPLKLDNQLITKTLSRPFVRRHVAIPIEESKEGLRLAITDPFDSTLLETLRELIQKPVQFSVASKSDILQIIERVYGFQSNVKKASRELGSGGADNALVQIGRAHV